MTGGGDGADDDGVIAGSGDPSDPSMPGGSAAPGSMQPEDVLDTLPGVGGGASGTPGTNPEPPVAVIPGAAGPGVISECPADAPVDVARTPLRRIARIEFNNAVRDLFGDASEPARDGTFPSDEAVGSFISNSATLLTVANNEQLLNTAEGVAQNAVANVAAATGCADTADTACLEGFLSTTAQRAFRGSWDATADAAILSLHQAASQELGADMGLETAIEAILLDARFLYMLEFGAESGSVARLNGREIAGRLAAFFWRSVPSVELLEAADAGTFDSPDGVETTAAGMLDDPRAQPMLRDFAEQWLQLGRIEGLTTADAAFTPEIRTAMREETVGAVITAASSGSFTSLLSGESAPPADLSAFYGGGPRVGVLTNGSFLAGNPGPVKRGRAVRQQIMCDTIPEPPMGVEDLMDDGTGATTTEIFRQHAEDQTCWACHQWMDPIGAGFSFYDSLGRYQETENGAALSAAGEFIQGSNSTLVGTFDGVEQMVGMLTADEFTHKCFTTQMVRYALGRNEQAADACSLGAIYARFSGSQLNIRELLVAIASSDLFAHRNIVRGGEACE